MDVFKITQMEPPAGIPPQKFDVKMEFALNDAVS